jgi:hypothetical protein
MTFTISGFSSTATNPTSTTYTIVNSFDSQGYQIDQSTRDILFYIQCIIPCKTCPTNSPNTCNSCYTNTSITNAIFYYATNS